MNTNGPHPILTSSHSLHLIWGCMYSGKTTELLRLLRTYETARIRCLMVKLVNDSRYGEGGEQVQTHDGAKRSCISVSKLSDITDNFIKDYDVIGIDEGHFFPDLLENTLKWSMVMKKQVIIAALNGTFNGKMFRPIIDIIPFVTSINFLTAICQYCHCIATLSMRTTSDTREIIIAGKSVDGTKDLYESVCCSCYAEHSLFPLPIDISNTNINATAITSGTTSTTTTATINSTTSTCTANTIINS